MARTGDVELVGAPAIDWLGVPLKSGETTFGAIVVQSYTESIRYGEKEKEILTFVSRHIATAIQRKADEERFRAVWEHSADGMRLTDKEGKIVMVNSAYSKIVKLPQEKLVGKFLSVTYANENDETIRMVYRERFETGSVTPRFNGVITIWNGEEVPVEISNSFIVFGLNNKMLLSVFRDITERNCSRTSSFTLKRWNLSSPCRRHRLTTLTMFSRCPHLRRDAERKNEERQNRFNTMPQWWPQRRNGVHRSAKTAPALLPF